MSKVVSRLLTFFIGVPLVIALIFLGFCNHLPLNIAIAVFSVIGANEFYNMLNKSVKLFPRPIILVFSGILPVLSYLFVNSNIGYQVTFWVFICEIILLMGIEGFFSKTFEKSIERIAYSSLIIFYTGLLITFLTKMTHLENSSYYFSLFVIFVFMCDSCAWFFGILFGKNNRGFIAASPNKSLIGFAGGIVGAIFFGLVFKYICSDYITCSNLQLSVLGLGTSIAAIFGDLIESVFKRSTGVKDSGTIIPGRGGALDSIDSILAAAPVFYIGLHFILQ